MTLYAILNNVICPLPSLQPDISRYIFWRWLWILHRQALAEFAIADSATDLWLWQVLVS